jgi:hypothetical protein
MPWFGATALQLDGTDYLLSDDGAQVNLIPTILEEMHSDSIDPAERIQLDHDIEIKALLIDGAMAGTFDSSTVQVITYTDVRLTIREPERNEYWYFSNMQVVQNWNLSFKKDGTLHLPVTLRNTSSTKMDIAFWHYLLTESIENILTEDSQIIEAVTLT